MQPFDLEVFSKRIAKFFLLNPFAKKSFDPDKFAIFLHSKIPSNNTSLKKSNYHLTRSFLIRSLSEFLEVKIPTIIAFFRQYRGKRSTANYNFNDEELPVRKRFSVLASVRKSPSTYKITNKKNKVVNNSAVKKIKDTMPDMQIAPSPIKKEIKSTGARKRAINAKGEVFEEFMSSNHPNSSKDLILWRKNTPEKGSPHRMRFSKKLAKKHDDIRLDLSNIFDYNAHKGTTEECSFTVTNIKLNKARKTSRACSQKAIMGNRSALEFFKAAGAELNQDETGRDIHHCHLQAHSLGGLPLRKNIAFMTKGANLCSNMSEKAITDLLVENIATKFSNKVRVGYHPEIGLPNKAEYFINADNREAVINMVVDPLSRKIPTRNDFEATYAFIKSEALEYSAPTFK